MVDSPSPLDYIRLTERLIIHLWIRARADSECASRAPRLLAPRKSASFVHHHCPRSHALFLHHASTARSREQQSLTSPRVVGGTPPFLAAATFQGLVWPRDGDAPAGGPAPSRAGLPTRSGGRSGPPLPAGGHTGRRCPAPPPSLGAGPT